MAKYVRGDRETQQALRRLRDDIAVPMNEAGRAALKPALAEAKANVPKKSGRLRRSLRIVRNQKSSRLRPRFRVGPYSTDKETFKHLSRLATILEFGRHSRAPFEGFAWLRRAFEATKKTIIDTYAKEIGPAIERRAAKVASRIRK